MGIVSRVWPVVAVSLLLMFVTFIVASFYTGIVPVDDRLELWNVGSTAGWSLVVPARGETGANQELVTRVAGIGKANGVYIVKRSIGEELVVFRGGESWNVRQKQPVDVDLESTSLRKPGNVQIAAVIREYWWLFTLESIPGIAKVVAVTLVARRRL